MRFVLLLAVCILAVVAVPGGVASAQNEGALPGSSSAGTTSRLFDHYVIGGGSITWFMLIPLSVATVALTIQYCFSIRRATVLPAATIQTLSEHLEGRRYVDAVQFAAQDRSMLGFVMHTAMCEASAGFDAMERAIEEAVEDRATRLFRRIEYLNIIGSISPMIGLFGTVVGMIGLFIEISDAGGIPAPARIAYNLGIALVTTFWGLLIAIPALSIYAAFRNRIEVLSAECALLSERLLSVLKPAGREPVNVGRAVPPAAAATSMAD